MDNSFYILARDKMCFERLHICTWEFPNESSYIEFGMEFSNESFGISKTLELFLSVPFIKKNSSATCLLENLSDSANGRFIFNDVVSGVDNVGEDSRDGVILKFDKRSKLTVLPCDISVGDGLISLKILKPKKYEGSLYFRFIVSVDNDTIAFKKKGIAKTSYIYDLKLNETRNLPQEIYDLKKNESLQICEVKNLFCLHAIPDNFEISFIDSYKLKNIRKLESEAFQKYLPNIKSISKDCYNILFLKDGNKDSYSLFTIVTKEVIGLHQIALAVGANILCSLLFALSSFRLALDSSQKWYQQIPVEYWIALGILIILCIYSYCKKSKK